MRALVAVLLLVSSKATAQRPASSAPPLCPLTDSLGVLITFFDVGQGDAALVESPGGRRVLIDGGQSATRVARELRRLGVARLELVVASHNHLDHIGGLPMVLQSVAVSNVMDNGMPATTAIYGRFVDAVQTSGARRLNPSARTLTLDAVTVRVLPPSPTARSQNDASVGLVIAHGAFRALFTGDAETSALESWLRSDSVPAVTLLKAGHHGSTNGITPEWAAATRPVAVVISVGAGNSYGHPAPSVIELWRGSARNVFRTDYNGTVRVRGCRDGSFTSSTSASGNSKGP